LTIKSTNQEDRTFSWKERKTLIRRIFKESDSSLKNFNMRFPSFKMSFLTRKNKKEKRKSNEHFFYNSNNFDNYEVEMPKLVKMRIWHLSKELTKLRVLSFFISLSKSKNKRLFFKPCVSYSRGRKEKKYVFWICQSF
jgi:hypothetical protein